MPRHNPSPYGFVNGACKIRKRGCSSASSSSSVLQNCRFKRAILAGKRGGSTTPMPSWKMNGGLPSSRASISESSRLQTSNISGGGRQGSVSARKLGNALWEMNKIPSPYMVVDLPDRRRKSEPKGRKYLAPHLSDPSHSPVSEMSDRSKSSSRKRMMPMVPWASQHNHHKTRASDFQYGSSLTEIDSFSQGLTLKSSIRRSKNHLKDLSIGLAASKELLKTLNHIWGSEEQHTSSISLVSALHGEIDQARLLVDQLIQEQRSEHDEINYLKSWITEKKLAWKNKEEERISAAVNSVMVELDSEKKLRRRAERLSKKLGLELAKTRTKLSRAIEELDNERRTREMIEQFCNELVRGISEDKAEVEQMKRESAKFLDELEKEREMLQLADVWREERVQMKLSEAKFQFEEKNAAVDQLRNELEAFLNAKRTKEPSDVFGDVAGRLDVEAESKATYPRKDCKATDLNLAKRDEEQHQEHGDEDDEIYSTDSELHSIELNVDSNEKRFHWSYAVDTANGEAKSVLRERNSEDNSSNLEIPSRRSSSIDGATAEGIKQCSDKSLQHSGGELGQGRQPKSSSVLGKQHRDLNEDTERYISVKGLRDRMLASSTYGMACGLASPTQQWSKLKDSQDMGDEFNEASKVSEMVRAIKENGCKIRK